MSFNISRRLNKIATNQPSIKAEQSKNRLTENHIIGNLPKAIKNLGDLITVNNTTDPSTVTIDQDKFREALTLATTTLASCIAPLPTLPTINSDDNLSDSLCEIGRFLGRHWQAIENSGDKTTIAVCLKQLEDITSAIGLIEAFSNDQGRKETEVTLDDASKKYLQGFDSHWDQQDITVNSWTGQITRVGNNQKKATQGLQAWGKYFSDFRAFHTATRTNNKSRKRPFGDSAKHLIGNGQWNPFQETQITADKLNAHHKKSIYGLAGTKKAQQCVSNAQNAMNHEDFMNAESFLQEGITALEGKGPIAKEDFETLARLIVESVLVKNHDNPEILSGFNPEDENSLGAFIEETNIKAIPGTNLYQIDQLKQDLKTALESRKNSLQKANQVKSLGIYTDLETVKPSVKLTEKKLEIAEARDAREVLVKLAQQADGIPKTANGIKSTLDVGIQAGQIQMADHANNIDVTIPDAGGDVTKTLTPADAWILVQHLNAEKANPTGAPIQFDDRLVTFTADGTISFVAGHTDLHLAALNGYTAVVQELLKKRADVTAIDKNGNTALHYAALNGHTAVVTELLATAGINVTAVNNDGTTALHYAALNGHTAVVTALLDKGANVKATDKNDNTPLHYAANAGKPEVVKALLDNGADVTAIDKNGNTALHYAANAGKPEVVKALLDKGADVNATDKNNNTPLVFAILNDHAEVIKALNGKKNDTDTPPNR